MPGLRRLAMPAAVSLVLAAASLAPGHAHGSAPPLVQTTSIAGDRTGYVEVELTKPLKPFSDEDMPEIRLEGGGAILGAVLRTGPAADGRYTTLEILRMDRQNEGSPILYSVGNGENGLPAGRYRLYLIVDRPGRVTLEFPSLAEGDLSLTPAVHTPFVAGPLDARPSSTPGTTAYGRMGELTSDGFVYSRAIVEDAPPGARLESCVYDSGQEAAAGDRAYGPGCPSGTAGHSEMAVEPGDMGIWTMSIFPSAGSIGHGGNFTTAVGSPKVDTFGMWMSYDFPTAPEPPPPNPPLTHREPNGTAAPARRRVGVKNGTARVALTCSVDERCRGYLRLSGAARKVAFDIPAGRPNTLKVPLTDAMRRRVARRRSAGARLVVVSTTGDGRRQVEARVTLVHRGG